MVFLPFHCKNFSNSKPYHIHTIINIDKHILNWLEMIFVKWHMAMNYLIAECNLSLKFQYVKNANWVRFPPIVSSLDVELAGAGYTNFRNTSPQGIQNTNLLPQQEDELREIKFFFALLLLSSVCYWLYQTDTFLRRILCIFVIVVFLCCCTYCKIQTC